MSRPMLIVFLLIVLIITSQFEWKQPLVVDQDTTPSASVKQLRISERQELIKEKIILSQERNIHDLKKIVRDLEEQLKLCRGRHETSNTTSRATRDNNVFEIEQTVTMHD